MHDSHLYTYYLEHKIRNRTGWIASTTAGTTRHGACSSFLVLFMFLFLLMFLVWFKVSKLWWRSFTEEVRYFHCSLIKERSSSLVQIHWLLFYGNWFLLDNHGRICRPFLTLRNDKLLGRFLLFP